MDRHARGLASPQTVFHGVTGRLGAHDVAARATYAVTEDAMRDTHAQPGAAPDAVRLASFGDPGRFGLRALAHQPDLGRAIEGRA